MLAGTRQVFIRLFVSSWISLTGGEPLGQEHMSEINEAIRLITDTASYLPLYLQPVTSHDQSLMTDYENLFNIQALALKSLPDVRILPQIHPIMNLL